MTRIGIPACAASVSHDPTSPPAAGTFNTSTWLARSSGTTPTDSHSARSCSALPGTAMPCQAASARSTNPRKAPSVSLARMLRAVLPRFTEEQAECDRGVRG